MEFVPEYKPPLFFRNGHVNTIFPYLFRKQEEPSFIRERFLTEDEDFFDVDFVHGENKRIAIICHGLEGSSRSKYVIGTARVMSKNAWDIAAMNHRSCSGEINKTSTMYHSGATRDLDQLVTELSARYEEIALVGFSLGGNMVLKYAGEKSDSLDSKVIAVVGISVPMDLRAGSLRIGQFSNYVYERKFLKTLLEKMKTKAQQFPELIDPADIQKCRSMYQFDDFFTAPLHGFKDADDYYAQCSSKFFVEKIKRPTMIINAMDDPFLPDECYPIKHVEKNPLSSIITPRYGGHVGFVEFGKDVYWEENLTQLFLERCSLL